MNEILPNLFISSFKDIINNNYIEEYNIKYIINLSEMNINFNEEIEQYRINIKDYEESDISKYFTKTSRIICNRLIKKENILVFCFAGKSRSASIIISFLIKKRHMSFEEAYKLMKEKNPKTSINEGFIKQLKNI